MFKKRPYSSYNMFFIIPFILWVVTGSIILYYADKGTVFRLVNTHYSAIGDVLMYYMTWVGEGVFITATLISMMVFVPTFRNWWYFITAALCNGIPPLVSQWVKHAMNKPRPLKYFNGADWIHMQPNWEKLFTQSFPSGHTTGAFAMFCFFAMLLPEKSKRLGLLFFVLAVGVGYSRMYLAAHFFQDVYFGSILGTGLSILFFAVMNLMKPYFFKEHKQARIRS